jgi:hypothetical protein
VAHEATTIILREKLVRNIHTPPLKNEWNTLYETLRKITSALAVEQTNLIR